MQLQYCAAFTIQSTLDYSKFKGSTKAVRIVESPDDGESFICKCIGNHCLRTSDNRELRIKGVRIIESGLYYTNKSGDTVMNGEKQRSKDRSGVIGVQRERDRENQREKRERASFSRGTQRAFLSQI